MTERALVHAGRPDWTVVTINVGSAMSARRLRTKVASLIIVLAVAFPFPRRSLYSCPLWADKCSPKRKMIAAMNRLNLGPLAPTLVTISCGVNPCGCSSRFEDQVGFGLRFSWPNWVLRAGSVPMVL